MENIGKTHFVRGIKDALKDNRLAWDVDAEGQYTLREPEADQGVREFQRILMKRAQKRGKKNKI